MLEVLFLVVIVLIALLLSFIFNSTQPKYNIAEKEQLLIVLKDKLKIIDKKFFQGKMKESVYFQLKEDLEMNIVLTELEILRMKKSTVILIEDKFAQLTRKFRRPTKFKKAKLKNLLQDLEFSKKELVIIEKMFLKKEIMQSTFEKLTQLKENEIIEKEIQIVHLVQEPEQRINPQN